MSTCFVAFAPGAGGSLACATVKEIQDKSLVLSQWCGIHRPAIQMILANSRLSGTEANPESLVSSAVESRLLVEHATTQVEGIQAKRRCCRLSFGGACPR